MPDAAVGDHAPPPHPLALVQSGAQVRALAQLLAQGRRVACSGALGSSTALVAGAVAQLASRLVLLVTAHLDDADEAREELAGGSVPATLFPALEALPGESIAAMDTFAQRLAAVRAISTAIPPDQPAVIVAPIQALMQLVPAQADVPRCVRSLTRGQSLRPGELTAWLIEAGYRKVDDVEQPGQFAQRGGIIDVFPPNRQERGVGEPVPVRLDFFGDELEKLSELDPGTNAVDRAVPRADVLAMNADEWATGKGKKARGRMVLEIIPPSAIVVLHETMEIVEQARGYFERVTDASGVVGPPEVLKLLEGRFHALAEVNQFSAGAQLAEHRPQLPFAPLPAFDKEAGKAVQELLALAAEDGSRAMVLCQNDAEETRCRELLAAARDRAPEHARAVIATARAYLHRGFVLLDDQGGRTLIVPYHELLSRFGSRRSGATLRHARALDTFLDFQEGDYVVHADHGVAQFLGLSLMKPRDLPVAQRPVLAPSAGGRKDDAPQEEYLTLLFAGQAKLHVPASQIDKVQKYVGGFAGKPPLSVLGGGKWRGQKERVAQSVKDLAAELLRVRAAREHLPGHSYPPDTPWQHDFEAQFPFEETPDQLAALEQIKRDMEAPRPMDRLLCGDVGFGKTELAVRAAFKACQSGKQVAVLAPTTVLVEQHERTFQSRFAGFPFRVASVSRFKSDGEVRAILEELRTGRVDVVIGTHRLLGKDVGFDDLGLVVIDEEQRFGVEHKESLLRLRLAVDVLTLSATPIPRTLHMAMLGIRDISSLTTPPPDRRAIVTEVIPFNQRRIEQAIARELAREGQVYFVHNRVEDILTVAEEVQQLAPKARVVVGHGQMPAHQLEEVMLRFVRRQADILVCTTIIESGIDNPAANTIIINDADRFGLSDLHQLRGRVGRSRHRAYCYLLLPLERTIKEPAKKRLKALEQYAMLGAGFKIAMRDLEIRGAGNILGPEQSGHIAAVGYEMYCRLLEASVHALKNEPAPEPPSTTSIEIGLSATIPRAYIPSDPRRLAAYRRIAVAASPQELAKAVGDITEAYGELPASVQRLVDLAQLRIALHDLGCRAVSIREKDVIFLCKDAQRLAAALCAKPGPGTVRALPPKDGSDLAEVYFRPPESYLAQPASLLTALRARLGLVVPQPAAPEQTPAREKSSLLTKSQPIR